ncbi:TadE family type IV pilus minor pilin [Microbacterium sp. 4NA327F11]|jgi:Flp pilus assembly protein TadG|uniref:TadE family type IV pilus minor pilin n=1 Tax=Microbacterium sp. 4NA327F11 TaxID=2502229 RepID=UPI0010F8DF56|nr:TadE family type IV pilus minor pilin [Microbacterium sp. 4NA327F11]
MPRPVRGDEGAVAAELAVALPALVLVVTLCVGGLAAASLQVRLQDAAADAARLLARGESVERAQSTVAHAEGRASMQVSRAEGLVCVAASAPSALPGLTMSARSCALESGW